jgi:hypothetical protein
LGQRLFREGRGRRRLVVRIGIQIGVALVRLNRAVALFLVLRVSVLAMLA